MAKFKSFQQVKQRFVAIFEPPWQNLTMRIIGLTAALFTLSFSHLASGHMGGCSDLLVPGPADPNTSQRQMSLALELSKFKPTEASTVFRIDPGELQSLSERNGNQLLKVALRRQRELRTLNNSTRDRLDQLVQGLEFTAVRTLQKPWWENLYDSLTENQKSIGFRLAVTPTSIPAARIQNLFSSDMIRLKRSFAKKHAFVLPQFTTIYKLLHIFEVWNPQVIEDLIRVNRYNLPQNIRTPRDFKIYLTPDRLEETFPPDALRSRLRPVREALHPFILTLEDAESIWTEIFRHYLLHAIKEGVHTIEDLEENWQRPGAVDRLFAEACSWMGFEGLSVRAPLSLTTDYYDVIYAR